ncbi:MAG: AAA family ATPase [Desulfuromusa sp.]|jgi:predicted ATP-dependent endonuclease of OLD family|nr:AAA family ATPase [Desulfuromusa sp.]
MRISKIKIQNFRSLKDVEITTSGFNVLIGQNNHGKTNLFEAVQWFYKPSGVLSDIRHIDATDDDEVVVEIEFSDVQEGITNISKEDNQTKIRNVIGESDTMSVRRSSKDVKSRELYNPERDEWKKQPCGADSAFNNCIPRFEFVEATKNLKDVSSYKSTTPIGQMLSGVVTEVLEQNQDYQDFQAAFEKLFQSANSPVRMKLKELSDSVQEYLAQQFPDCSEVDFDVEEPAFDELLKNYKTRLDDGVKTTAEEKGDGMQRALMLAIIKTHADFRREEALGRSFIFFIDEAELHLHPTGQRQLKQALLELTGGVDQVFLTTHSSVFIADEHGQQTIFEVNKEDKCTAVEQVEKGGRQHVVYQLLGGNPADLLLPANFLIVEGPSEELFLSGLIKRFYADKAQIQVLPANGDDERQRQSMDAVNLVFDPLKVRPIYKTKLVILLDQPNGEHKQTRFEEFKNANRFLERNCQLHVLDVNGLEDYYPSTLTEECRFTDKKKKAKWMASQITQEQFESEMPIIFKALEKCWAEAYGEDPEEE